MTPSMGRWNRHTVHADTLHVALAAALPALATEWGAGREFREGQREIARERREMLRETLRADSPREARRAYREGQAEIARERREMLREVGRELRYGSWDRDRNRVGEIVAGVALCAVIAAVAHGVAPTPPFPELCWFWSDSYQERGYWDCCGGYAGC